MKYFVIGVFLSFLGLGLIFVAGSSVQASEIFLEQAESIPPPAPRVVAVKSPAAVAGDELPRTGPSLLAALLTGLLPVGWRLRRFGRGETGDGSLGRFIWQTRELEREA